MNARWAGKVPDAAGISPAQRPCRARQKEKPVLSIPQVTGSTVQGTVDIKSDEIMNGADDAAMTARSKIVRPIKGWKRR